MPEDKLERALLHQPPLLPPLAVPEVRSPFGIARRRFIANRLAVVALGGIVLLYL